MTRVAATGGLQATLTDELLLPGGTTSVTARGEGAYTWTDVPGSGLIAPLAVPVWRGSLAVEGAHERALPGGSRIRPAVEVGVRYDGGDGMAGAGLELGGSLRYLVPWGLTLEGRGRFLVAHESAYQEWAAGGRVSLELSRSRQGLSLSLAPSYGRTASGVQRLWERGAAALVPSAAGTPRGRLDAEVSYGIPVADDQILVTPYGRVSLNDGGTQRFQVGGRLELGPAFQLDLKAEHGVRPSGDTSRSIALEGTLRL